MPSRVPIDERFWPKVDMSDPDGCWPWTSATDKDGYGLFKVTWEAGQPKQEKAHRVCWILTRGPIPVGLGILHTCDNPPCCRPSHHFAGTALVNRRDSIQKGRLVAAKGERVGSAKLTEEIVIQIRQALAQGIQQKDLAAKFHVNQATVSSIGLRKSWRHV